MDSLKVWKLSQVPLLGALSSELTVQRENLIHHLGDEWKRLVIWKLPPSNGTMTSKTELNYSFQIWLSLQSHHGMQIVIRFVY